MAFTLQTLLDADPERVHAAAEAWLAVAGDLDDACEDLIRGSRDLPYAWPLGPAAQAAQQANRDLRAEASNTEPPCRRIGQALRTHADTIRSLQEMARQIAAEATSKGFVVDLAAGTVAAGTALASDSSAGQQLAQAISSYVQQLQGIIERAVDLDSSTMNAIQVNLPDPRTGFGTGSIAPVTAAALQGQKGRPPADVKAWWDSLTPQQQEDAITTFPDLVGWLDGVPASDRDIANRLFLHNRQDQLQSLEDGYRRRIAELQSQGVGDDWAKQNELGILLQEVGAIDAMQAKLAPVDAALTKLGGNGLLLGIDPQPGGDGKVIIAVGNPDTAQHTAVWAPGLGTTLEGNTKDNVDRMIALNEAANAHADPGETVSTVYWLGYDAPELDSVGFEDRSKAGGPPYLNFMESMRATHEGPANHLTAMGHSYGSTVVGEAAKTGNLRVDDILVQGSPGMHVDHARDLHVDPRHVWAGASSTDPVSGTTGVQDILTVLGGGVGQMLGELYADGHDGSPHYQEFGANKYHVDTPLHTSYWDRGSDSLNNQGAIIAGNYEAVTLDHGTKPENR
ncbi:alpha/beta hydrolase family protein [Krasilnikovia cinnamomea]|uniref:Alpha/beta hydrolase family protein n=1 Tax=Krasilnikovia cinnamomea TaxID=349313 RepID=A0A4Q7ZDJ3_9ACTN|nr:alpha/beta hydrolase [Krasilnikovia cinnamomea]RZU48750.1 alpha/beta hydrolase family protein [Krasilnikovia cinnamomea]